MKKQRKDIEVAKLQLNTGQIDWLPANPRQWTREDLEKTKASIERDPDFLEDRPILVLPFEDGYVVFGGNLRTASSRDLERETIPAVIYTVETDEDKQTVKRRALLDNGSFGAWDMDALANEWDDMPLTDFGIPVWNVEEEVKKAEKEEAKAAQVPFTEVLNEEHNYICLVFDNTVDWLQAQTIFGLEPAKAWPTSKNEQSEAFQNRIGVGRVINGAKAIEKIMNEKSIQK